MKRQKKSTSKKSFRPKNDGCYFTQTGTSPDYKEVLTLKRFLSDRNRILPQKYSGLTSKNQRLLAIEVKKARYMGLIPYTEGHAIWYHIFMPVLCAYIDLHNISLLLYKSPTESWFEVFPYVYSNAVFSASFDSDSFYFDVFEKFCVSHNIDISSCDIALTGFLEPPVIGSFQNSKFASKTKIKVSKSLYEVAKNVQEVYPFVVNNHVVFTNDFCLSDGSVIPLKKIGEILDVEEENYYANYEIYPQIIPNDIAVQLDLDTNLGNLLEKVYKNENSKSNQQEQVVKYLPTDKPIVFCGSRFTQPQIFKELEYLLLLSFIKEPGIYDARVDTFNKFLLTSLLKMCDPTITISDEMQNLPKEATIISSTGPIECVIYTDEGTSQLLQLEKNRLLLIPATKDERVQLSLKTNDFGSVEKTVEGSNLGLIFDTRESKTINSQDIKTFSISLKSFKTFASKQENIDINVLNSQGTTT